MPTKKRIDINDNFCNDCMKKAWMAYNEKDLDTCIDYLLDVLKRNSEDFRANYLMGLVMHLKNDNKSALKYLHSAADAYPSWFKFTDTNPSGEEYMDEIINYKELLELIYELEPLDAGHIFEEKLNEISDDWGDVLELKADPNHDMEIGLTVEVNKNGWEKSIIEYNPSAQYEYDVLEMLYSFDHYQMERNQPDWKMAYCESVNDCFRTKAFKKEFAALNPEVTEKELEGLIQTYILLMETKVEEGIRRYMLAMEIFRKHEGLRYIQALTLLKREQANLTFYNLKYDKLPQKMRSVLVEVDLAFCYLLEYMLGIRLDYRYPANEEERKIGRMINSHFLKNYIEDEMESEDCARFIQYVGKKVNYEYVFMKFYDLSPKENGGFNFNIEGLMAQYENYLKVLRDDYTERLNAGEESVDLYYTIVNYELDGGNNVEIGLKYADKLLELDPEHVDCLDMLYRYYEEKKDKEKMAHYKQRLLAIIEKRPELKEDFESFFK